MRTTEIKKGDEVKHKVTGDVYVTTGVSDIHLEDGLIWCSLMDISTGRFFAEIDTLLEKTGNHYEQINNAIEEIRKIKEETND